MEKLTIDDIIKRVSNSIDFTSELAGNPLYLDMAQTHLSVARNCLEIAKEKSTMTEKEFSKQFGELAKLKNCDWIVIPDVIPFKTRRGVPIARKRPFDGILVTPACNIAIELKIDYRQLKEHQLNYLHRIAARNGLAFIVRFISVKNGKKYRVETPDLITLKPKTKTVLETTNFSAVFDFFLNR